MQMKQSKAKLRFEKEVKRWRPEDQRLGAFGMLIKSIRVSLNFNVFDLDSVDIDDAPANANLPAESLRRAFIDERMPPAYAIIVAQDRPPSTGLDCPDMRFR